MGDVQQWEYQFVESMRSGLLQVLPHLNIYGAAGWEAVGIVPQGQPGEDAFIVMLKRRVSQEVVRVGEDPEAVTLDEEPKEIREGSQVVRPDSQLR